MPPDLGREIYAFANTTNEAILTEVNDAGTVIIHPRNKITY